MLNHIAPKLAIDNEQNLIERLQRASSKSLRILKQSQVPQDCPASEEISALSPDRYKDVYPLWVQLAREITVNSCKKKMDAYDEVLKTVKDKHWKEVFTECYNKNLSYIEGMGYIVNKKNQVEKV